MTREEIDPLLELAQDMENELQAIKNALYTSDEDYEDDVLMGLMSLEKVATTFIDTVKYIDEQLLLKELEIKEDELDQSED